MSGPSGAPRNVQVTMHENGILVTWMPPPAETQNGPLTGYIVSLCGMCACTYIVCVSVCLSVCLSMAICLSFCLFVCLSMAVCLSFFLFVSFSVCLCLSVCLWRSVCLSVCFFICLFVCLWLSVFLLVTQICFGIHFNMHSLLFSDFCYKSGECHLYPIYGGRCINYKFCS